MKCRLRLSNRCNSLNSVISSSFIHTGQFSNHYRKELCYCDCYALDLAKNLAPFYFTNEKQIQNRWQLVHVIFSRDFAFIALFALVVEVISQEMAFLLLLKNHSICLRSGTFANNNISVCV